MKQHQAPIPVHGLLRLQHNSHKQERMVGGMSHRTLSQTRETWSPYNSLAGGGHCRIYQKPRPSGRES